MYYYAKLQCSFEINKGHYWANKSKEDIMKDIVIPFINGQVIQVKSNGQKRILNMKGVAYLNIFKTEEKVKKDPKADSLAKIITSKDFSKYDCTEEIINEFKNNSLFPTKSNLERKFAEVKNDVFIIMKFGSKELDSAYEGAIEPIVREFKLNPVRVDKIKNSGKITDQIIDSISTSKYVIADLTGERPNTYYETGFAHALGKEVILTIKKGEKIHFDLSVNRFIQWETESELRKELRERLSSLEQNLD